MGAEHRKDFTPDASSVASGVKQSIAWVDRLAWIALVFTVTAAISRIFGDGGLSLVGINLPDYGAWLGIAALTIAHFFVSKHIILSCADAWRHLDVKQRNSLFDESVRTGGIMTKGANKYCGAITKSEYKLELKTELSEPPTWVHHLLVLSVLLA
jgi:hypothetical protein